MSKFFGTFLIIAIFIIWICFSTYAIMYTEWHDIIKVSIAFAPYFFRMHLSVSNANELKKIMRE